MAWQKAETVRGNLHGLNAVVESKTYARVGAVGFGLDSLTFRFDVYASEEVYRAGGDPMGSFPITLGSDERAGDPGVFDLVTGEELVSAGPDIPGLMTVLSTDAKFAAALDTVKAKAYELSKIFHHWRDAAKK